MKKGFTLVEVIVTIGILAVITFVGSFAFKGTMAKIRNNQTIEAEKKVASLIYDYARRKGTLPSSDLSEITNKPDDPISYPMASAWYFTNYTVYAKDSNGNNILPLDLKQYYPFFADSSVSYYGSYASAKEPYSTYITGS